MRNRIILFLSAIIVSVTLISCKKPQDQVDTIFAINTTTAVRGDIHNYIEINGDVKPITEADVFPDNMGKLVRIYVNIGDRIYAGQTVAEVDPSKPGMPFSISPVRSTLTGTVIEVSAQVGSTVSPQTPIIKVGVISDVKIISHVSERFIARMRPDLPVFVKVEAYPDQVFQARVSELSPVVDQTTRMLEIRSRLLRPDSLIKPGMFARLKIIIEKKQGILKIPSDAIVDRFGTNYVFVVKSREMTPEEISAARPPEQRKPFFHFFAKKSDQTDDTQADNTPLLITYVERRIVQTGIRIDGKVEIISGLEEGEEIAVRGQTLLEDQTKVNVINRLPPLTVEDPIN